ncbi:DsrE family protein [Thioalkalivibrio thiocyanoxidans]|uniref:DsrE family protein n=1 Tax=Thioalkalivibrio thiocyanoxidans TaxID=152475 RepID=UPI00035D8EC7|nr:DsrE family protein [Thioalkalivibrio thiocyanoxidans]
MRTLKTLAASAVLAIAGASGAAQAAEPNKLFVSLTSADEHTQFMSMVLANQTMRQGQEIRVLLCGPAATMATDDFDGPTLEPAGRNAQQLLMNLINNGAKVETCAIFLPNTDYTEADLLDGITPADPEEVGAYMADPSVRFFSN